MFDIEKFEAELFILVNRHINEAYSCLKKQGEEELLTKYVPLQLQMLSIFHGIIEETVGEASHALILLVREKAHKKKIRLFDMRKKIVSDLE